MITAILHRSIKVLLKILQGERNKNDTWGEKELSKYISGSAAGGKGKPDSSAQRKQKTTTDAYGSYGYVVYEEIVITLYGPYG